jgi:uncharacterized protein (TIGR00251 family)
LQPRASRNEILGIAEGRLKVRVQAPPVGGAANKQCRDLLAKTLRLSKARVTLLKGEKARDKVFLLSGIAATDVLESFEGKHTRGK